MSDKLTLARPYAKASYEFALEKKRVDQWHNMLIAINEVVSNEQVQAVLHLPEVENDAVESILMKVLSSVLDSSAHNFLKLLIANKRLLLISEILFLFEKIKSEAEGTIDVNITTAISIDEKQQEKFAKEIGEQLGKKIQPVFQVDESLIAGAVVRLGEMNVVDGSLKTQLLRMREKFK